MYSKNNNFNESNSSTPKRRRLGTRRILRDINEHNLTKSKYFNSPLKNNPCDNIINSPQRCDSPLPCNQVEYLCEEANISSSSSDIPCSPCVLENSLIKDVKWESLIVSTNKNSKLCDENVSKISAIEEIDEDLDDLFTSKLEASNQVNHAINRSLLHNNFKETVQESFDAVNQTICQHVTNNCDRSSLFVDTKDSFLLDIRESGLLIEDKCKNKISTEPNIVNKFSEGFYGLPLTVKSLFKTYRNIEKFYDWQEECLNLDAIKNRNNLIYALPTSGGKTLVAEVLMLREVLVRNNNALFILPFVALVQEKIWALSPFAVQLDFLVEEYAAGKGHIPPKKRRRKKSIYIATIEKGLMLIRSLIELGRLDEIGLIVVDELHLIGEKGRGGTLEMLLSTVIFTNPNIQIVGMSATIGNLPELAKFLKAEVFQRQFRPVELAEYVKIDDQLYRMKWCGNEVELEPSGGKWECPENGRRLDPDCLSQLVWSARVDEGRSTSPETAMEGGCLVFCPTKRNCENVAALLCKLQPRWASSRLVPERAALASALRREGAGAELCAAAARGVAVHHAGLAQDERTLLEHGFRCGVISVLCCTSTLAAGVNLPAQRVIVRAPRVGREALALAHYRQMVGRAGRAGHCTHGESVLLCSSSEWAGVRGTLCGGVAAARSQLAAPALLAAGVALRLAASRPQLCRLLQHTLLANRDSAPIDVNEICNTALEELFKSGALEVKNKAQTKKEFTLNDDDELAVSKLGQAAIQGCMELSAAKQLLSDLEIASRALVLMGSLHLLYIVSPHDAAGIRPDYRHYYSLYCNLDMEGIQTAKILGITEMNAIRMMTGKPITNVSETVIRRFYVALMLHDLWKQLPLPIVAEKYSVSRGTVQAAMTSASSLASAASRVCETLPRLWTFAALLAELARRLQHCAAPELEALMDLPNVKRGRALQLVRAGYKRVEDLAKASVDHLTANITHLSRTAADHLISAARMMLIEKVENLRAEAEDVMEELNI